MVSIIQQEKPGRILGLIHEVENSSKKLNEMMKITYPDYWDIDDEELPF